MNVLAFQPEYFSAGQGFRRQPRHGAKKRGEAVNHIGGLEARVQLFGQNGAGLSRQLIDHRLIGRQV